jgi:L-lactate dehydrogenase complex protein LldG
VCVDLTGLLLERELEEFRAKAGPLGVAVHRVPSQSEAARLAAEWAAELGAQSVVVAHELAKAAPEFLEMLASVGIQILPSGAPDMMRDAPLGASLAQLAIAETGSTLLAEPTLEDRSVGLLTLAQLIVCPMRSLVASLDDAAVELRRLALAPGGSFSTLVTGPSRTADIERVLTVGVQGPGKVRVVFVDSL